jgi:hypothetical protein
MAFALPSKNNTTKPSTLSFLDTRILRSQTWHQISNSTSEIPILRGLQRFLFEHGQSLDQTPTALDPELLFQSLELIQEQQQQ